MDTRMLEVVMGLALVLALVSLLAAILHEALVAKLGRRGDVLTLALCSLLGDRRVTQTQRLRRTSSDMCQFSQQLLQHPMLVSQVLGSGTDPVKGKAASYLDSRVFTTALLAFGSDRAGPGAMRPASPADWVTLMGTPSPHQPAPTSDLVANLRAMLAGVEEDWPAFERRVCAWYDSVMDRATGWFQRDTQFRLFWIGTIIAALGNINPLVIGGRLWNDPLLRAAFVDSSTVALEIKTQEGTTQAATGQNAAKTGSTKQTAKPAAKKAVQPSVGLTPAAPLASATDRAVLQLRERVLAWGDTRVVRAGEDAADKVATLQNLVHRIDNLREDIARRRQAWQDGASTETLLTYSLTLERTVEELRQVLDAQPEKIDQGQLDRVLEMLKFERNQQLRESVATAQSLCGQAQGGALEAACKELAASEQTGLGELPLGWTLSNWPGCAADCQRRVRMAQASELQRKVMDESMDSAEALRRVVSSADARDDANDHTASVRALTGSERLFGVVYSLCGWMMVGIASMLGSTFWFDLLSKVAKLRAAGLAAKLASEADTSASDSAAASPSAASAASAGGILVRGSSPAASTAPAAAVSGPVPRAGRVPLYPDGNIHVLSEQQVRDLYGDIRTTETAGVVTLTNPGVGAVKRNLVDFRHPVLQGKRLQVHERALAHFQAAFDAIEAAQLGHLVLSCEGTVSLRHIGHDPKNALSHHCWGIAIDLNAFANAYGAEPAAVGQPGSVRELVPILNRYGFAWGGHFNRKLDGMHFELALLDPNQAPQPLAGA
ncbi:M15 family metallopeptidase [Ideonella alba]|uniref:M15 family metallopeptidase n=1 Tax=Ideonella alba TaxID=2824118 RepID=A0A940YEN1_9BURK|nr:M15 family metallopeptidase [Ideonella alba]MBQ0931167.1 M15 family metallopeptidase [Ideonella alba]